MFLDQIDQDPPGCPRSARGAGGGSAGTQKVSRNERGAGGGIASRRWVPQGERVASGCTAGTQ